jgi:hypothetical protein
MKPSIAFVLACAAFLGACASDEIGGTASENQAPNIWISAAPPEGSTSSYSVQLFWGGWDPDGEISFYEYLITDNVKGTFNPADTVGAAWSSVVANDSTFTFSADSLSEIVPGQLSAVFTRSHTFFIRAVDLGGLRSVEPAYRSFTARTLSPDITITTPRQALGLTPSEVPPIATYEWTAVDYVDDLVTRQPPDSVHWALVSTRNHNESYLETIDYLRTAASAHDWYPWVYYSAPHDSGKMWTTPPMEFGDYVFAMRAKDEAGAVTPVLDEHRNVRRIKVSRRTTGPRLIVSNQYVGSVVASTCNYPLTILDMAAGVGMAFTLSACADDYGGTVSGYRYGWDILDLNDPDQWEVDYTPFLGSFANVPPRSFNFGTHTFTAEVIDNSGFCSRVEVKVNIVRFSGQRNLLVVDDYSADENPGFSGFQLTNGSVPNDTEHDAFWFDMVSNVDGFDPLRDAIAVSTEREIPLTTFALYKAIVWSVFSDVTTTAATRLPLLYQYIQFRSTQTGNTTSACSAVAGVSGTVVPNSIALAMQAGVHVLIAGQQPVQNVLPRRPDLLVRWPMIPLYETEDPQTGSPDVSDPPGENGFAYQDLCLEAIDFGYLPTSRARIPGGGSNRRYCPVSPTYRQPGSASPRDDTMRGALPLDPSFPPLSLRPEVAAAGRAYAPEAQGIDVEVYNPTYFRTGEACQFVPDPRPCFEPIYGLDSRDTTERTYLQPVAFWTSAYADVVAQDIPGAVGARSAVFGFPPVYFNPSEVKPAIEFILFDEWQLPRATPVGSSSP